MDWFWAITFSLLENTNNTGTWKCTRGVGVSGRLVPIMRTMLRYWPHSWLSHTGTSYRQEHERKHTHTHKNLIENWHSHKFTQSVSPLISLDASLRISDMIIIEACVHSPCLEALQSTPGRCAANPGYPLLKTLEGLFHAPGDDGKAPVSLNWPDKRLTQNGCHQVTYLTPETKEEEKKTHNTHIEGQYLNQGNKSSQKS